MFETLFGKLTAILLVLFIVVGVLFVPMNLLTTKMYIQEVDQRLNRDLSRYLVSRNLYLEDGKVNEKALKESFEVLMHINPSIELYLLDANGLIIDFSAPPGRVKRERVSLDAVKEFLGGEKRLPILGDDPRNPSGRKPFSASPIPLEGQPEGYLYVILGGEEYASIASLLKGSYILRLSTWGLVLGLAFVFIAGLFFVKYLTKKLGRLSTAMENFKRGNFNEPVMFSQSPDKPLRDEIDKIGVVFGQMSDLIIKQMNKIREADSLRREMVSNVSHDLRTPLTAMQGYLETLSMKWGKMTPEEVHSYLDITMKHSQRLGKLVSELFELAKLDSGEIQLDLEQCHPGELLHDIAQKYRPLAKKNNISLDIKFPENLPFVSIDIGLIERAMDNLIDNAFRYTGDGDAITLSLIPGDEAVTVQVSDSGSGIREEDIPHIFERYYSTGKESSNNLNSTGLGLAITKRIVDMHEGHIEVASILNQGTTFTFILPVWVAEPGE